MFEIQEDPIRYVHYFDNDIEVDTVQELIDILVNYTAVDLFITTPGGCLSSSTVLMHFINNHPDMRIYLTNYIASAGTFFLTDCNKEIIISNDLHWMLFHQGDRPVEGQFRRRKINEVHLFNQLKEFNDECAAKYKKLGLTSKEIKDYMNGEDVILYRKDFSRLKINKK